jgi:hypothetical protein
MVKLLFDGSSVYLRGSHQKIISIRVNTGRSGMQGLSTLKYFAAQNHPASTNYRELNMRYPCITAA